MLVYIIQLKIFRWGKRGYNLKMHYYKIVDLESYIVILTAYASAFFLFVFLAFDMMAVVLSNRSVMGNPSSSAGLCHDEEQRKVGFSFLQTFFATEEHGHDEGVNH